MVSRRLWSMNLTLAWSGTNNAVNFNGSRFSSRYTVLKDQSDSKVKPYQLKQWRREWDTGQVKLPSKLKVFDRGLRRPSLYWRLWLNEPWDLRVKTIRKWAEKKYKEVAVHDQRFIPERHKILGSNLACAHFLVKRGAKVRFVGRPEWVEKDKNDNYNLPTKYTLRYVIEAIDVNGINLYYEGLENMIHLNKMKWLSLKGCKTIDDWCLDKISNQYPVLEYLDISDCVNVSERGLEALYRMTSLRTLVVTNNLKSAAFELTCMMLEDVLPNLRCDIRLPEVQTAKAQV